ncbi:MAG: hypothetical protein II679_06965 [Ruminococcus sp.]|nr:hypothetical protein [Ruminococcus sp.]
MSCKLVAKIAVEKAVYSFDREFDYAVPDDLSAAAAVGKRVLVPLAEATAAVRGSSPHLLLRKRRG